MKCFSDIVPSGSVVLAPMAGVTEAPFRGICKRMGAALTYTEMVSAKGLHYNPDSGGSRALLSFDDAEVPAAVQIFGSDARLMAEQAARIVDLLGEKVALIDINMGCPVAKVVGKGEGSALMRDPEVAAFVVSRVARSVDVPVTAKFRKGWDDATHNAVEFALRLQDAGAAALAVHGRTREQFYRGKADWHSIAAVKDAVDVPVMGSGDVFTADDVVAMFEHTGVDAVMVARGAQGNPWIFREVRALLDAGERVAPPTNLERIDMARAHAAALVGFSGLHSFVRMRKHVAWYVSGMPGATHVRARVNDARSYEELDELLGEYRDYVQELEARRS